MCDDLESRGSGSSSMATNYGDDDDGDGDHDDLVDGSSIRTRGTRASLGYDEDPEPRNGDITTRQRTVVEAATVVMGAERRRRSDWEEDIAFGRDDAVRLVAALADVDSSSKINSVTISQSLQYALFYYSNGPMTNGASTRAPKRNNVGSVSTHSNANHEPCNGSDGCDGSDHHGEGEVSSLVMLLARVGTLPNLRELLIEGEDRITQFVSTGTLPAVIASIQPSIPNLQRLQIDAMLALPEHSIQALALCLSRATNLIDLTLSQLHFPTPTSKRLGNGDRNGLLGIGLDLDESGRSNNNDDNDDFLLPLVGSLASLGQLRRVYLGCVVDRPSRSALTLDCLRTLVCRPSSIQVLKLDSFKVTDSHLAALRDVYTCRRRGSSGSRVCGAPPSALESLCLYRCGNQQFTERGCRSLLQLLESRYACHIQYLFVSPRALQASWTSTHPSNFQRQIRLLCLLNQIRRRHRQPQNQQQDSVTSVESNSTVRVRKSWIKLLATCNGDVNASYSILVKNPDLVRAANTAANVNATEGGIPTTPIASHQQPDQCSKRRRTGSVSSPAESAA